MVEGSAEGIAFGTDATCNATAVASHAGSARASEGPASGRPEGGPAADQAAATAGGGAAEEDEPGVARWQELGTSLRAVVGPKQRQRGQRVEDSAGAGGGPDERHGQGHSTHGEAGVGEGQHAIWVDVTLARHGRPWPPRGPAAAIGRGAWVLQQLVSNYI